MKFDPEIYKVKAIVMNEIDEKNGEIVCGHYYQVANTDFVDVANQYDPMGYPISAHCVNPYSICRNTGFRVGCEYLYEFDLIEYGTSVSGYSMGIIEFDDRFGFMIKGSANWSSKKFISDNNIKSIIGNVILSSSDAEKFQAYSDKEDEKGSINTEPECRSTQHINKLKKQFLPK